MENIKRYTAYWIIICVMVNIFTGEHIHNAVVEPYKYKQVSIDHRDESVYFGLVELISGNRSDHATSVSWSPDCEFLAVGYYDFTNKKCLVKIFEAKEWKCIRNLTGFSNTISCVAWSPDGSKLAVGSWDNTIRIFNTDTWNCIFSSAEHTGPINCVSWSPDGSELASSSLDTTIKFWNIDSGTCVRTLSVHSSNIKCVSWSPNGTRFASCADNDVILIWDTDSWNATHILNHSDCVRSIAWSPDGSLLASCSGLINHERSAKIWNTTTWQCIKTFEQYDIINRVSWSPDGSLFAYGDFDNKIYLWDTETWENTQTFSKPAYDDLGKVQCLSWSSDGTLASGHWDYSITVIIWGIDSDKDGTGDKSDVYPNDPAAYQDSDGDGYPDDWSEGKSQGDSTTGLHLDSFPHDPAASLDVDSDGFPDAWNPNKSENDSSSDPPLKLDAYPNNPLASVDTDGDGYPDGTNNDYNNNNMGPLPNENIVALWHLNEYSGNIVHDSSGNGNDGTLSGASWERGLFGNGLKFDNENDIVIVPDSDSLSITGAITIEIWIKTERGTTTHLSSPLITKNGNNIPSYHLGFYGNEGNIEFYINSGNPMLIVGDKNLNDGGWHHVVGTWRGPGTEVKLYVDGEEDGVHCIEKSSMEDTDHPLSIGSDYYHARGVDTRFIIDEIVIYNCSLTPWKIWEHSKGIYNPSFHFDGFPEDPAASLDVDNDGYPDKWNEGMNSTDSTSGLRIDAFPNDPAASLDTDGDGYPDKWNDYSGYSSTTGLILDDYPNDPDRHEKVESHLIKNPKLFGLVVVVGMIVICWLLFYYLLAVKKKNG